MACSELSGAQSSTVSRRSRRFAGGGRKHASARDGLDASAPSAQDGLGSWRAHGDTAGPKGREMAQVDVYPPSRAAGGRTRRSRSLAAVGRKHASGRAAAQVVDVSSGRLQSQVVCVDRRTATNRLGCKASKDHRACSLVAQSVNALLCIVSLETEKTSDASFHT
jgi:hypothetical protein